MIELLNWTQHWAAALVAISVPLTVVLGILLLVRGWVLQRYGARYQYALWLLAPLSAAVLLLPPRQPLSSDTPLYQLQVIAGQTGQQLAAETARWSLLPLCWLFGLVGLLMVLVYQYGRLTQLVRDSQPVAKQSRELQQLSAVLPTHLELRFSSQLVGPLITGLWRPTVLLPADFSMRYTKEQQLLIVRHELTHWQRGDLAANVVALCMLLLFWFNPLSWLAYRAYRQDQELACDALVLATASTEQKVAYSYALLAQNRGNSHWALLSHAYGDKKMMKQRLVQLQRQQGMHKSVVCLLLAGMMAVVYSLNTAPAAAGDINNQEPKVIVRIEPKYPVQAAADRIEGYTRTELQIDEKGSVVSMQIIESVPAGVFDDVSKRALQKWRFTPAAAGKVLFKTVQLDFEMDKDPAVEKLTVLSKQ